jgi:RNA-splicing ligase RtcB
MKCVIIPVIIGATGIVTKGLLKIWKPYWENIQYVHYKADKLRTSHILRKVLKSEASSLSGGGSRLLSEEKFEAEKARDKRQRNDDDDDDDDDDDNIPPTLHAPFEVARQIRRRASKRDTNSYSLQ